jgi:hypothetical protein
LQASTEGQLCEAGKKQKHLTAYLQKISETIRNRHVPQQPVTANNVTDREGKPFVKVFHHPDKHRCHYRENNGNPPKKTHCMLNCNEVKKTMVIINGETDHFCGLHVETIKGKILKNKNENLAPFLMLMKDAPTTIPQPQPQPPPPLFVPLPQFNQMSDPLDLPLDLPFSDLCLLNTFTTIPDETTPPPPKKRKKKEKQKQSSPKTLFKKPSFN